MERNKATTAAEAHVPYSKQSDSGRSCPGDENSLGGVIYKDVDNDGYVRRSGSRTHFAWRIEVRRTSVSKTRRKDDASLSPGGKRTAGNSLPIVVLESDSALVVDVSESRGHGIAPMLIDG
ncbi:BZ3500_MvSof-1268-A1-R1_Chr4-2g07119 [Microbotryum saponariae]|uniref:BZ3500_MvSof-1268-A1-R1_Chr4-2g07119 protein n=1 Tax=Microbotryum saponariae TaxID=289078 RepID=A0A2X0KZ92_9BASI|nr:BZ3500_MvSof-1268-A1-R1_Chr4-2g07119 [Microbotryum saponariae]SDA06784.1 BZ3501_MvSof-1269-A2-R1_Chr4-2g06830 [Microbotryum saponariae]